MALGMMGPLRPVAQVHVSSRAWAADQCNAAGHGPCEDDGQATAAVAPRATNWCKAAASLVVVTGRGPNRAGTPIQGYEVWSTQTIARRAASFKRAMLRDRRSV